MVQMPRNKEWSKGQSDVFDWSQYVSAKAPRPEVGGRDKDERNAHTQRMSEINREEIDAKLEATQAKVDARLAGFEGTVRETLAAVRQDSAEMRGELKLIHAQLGDLQNIKRSIWGAAAATIIGVAGIIATMLSFGIASFDTGRETSQLVESAKQQTEATQKLLEQMQQSQQKPPPSQQ